MALPVCKICAKNRVLCAACEGKLSEGRINEFDVEVSRILYELFGDETNFTRAVNTENYVVILTAADEVGRIIGKGGRNIRVISERLGKQVRVVGEGDFEEMVRAFVAPARVRSINTLYRPDGSTAVRIRVDKTDKNKLRISSGDLMKVISGITDKDIELTFD
jgi:transcription antitermination factor NusA-like protein